jgi:hypothetical protein
MTGPRVVADLGGNALGRAGIVSRAGSCCKTGLFYDFTLMKQGRVGQALPFAGLDGFSRGKQASGS